MRCSKIGWYASGKTNPEHPLNGWSLTSAILYDLGALNDSNVKKLPPEE